MIYNAANSCTAGMTIDSMRRAMRDYETRVAAHRERERKHLNAVARMTCPTCGRRITVAEGPRIIACGHVVAELERALKPADSCLPASVSRLYAIPIERYES